MKHVRFRESTKKREKQLIVVLLSILIISCGTQTTIPSPVATLDEKIILQENINQVLGSDNQNVPRLTKISYDFPERSDITITWVIHEYELQESTKVNAQVDATNILKILQQNKTRFVYVILIGTFSSQDENGNTTEIQAFDIGFNKSKLDLIHWEDFQPADIYNLADVAHIENGWE